MVLEIEDIVAEDHTAFNEVFTVIAHDFHCMKSQLLRCTRLIQSWLEDIRSELVVEDGVVSMLDLCHMETLSETVMGLNAEKMVSADAGLEDVVGSDKGDQPKAEPDDWEDTTDISTSKLETQDNGVANGGVDHLVVNKVEQCSTGTDK
ncbi:hypothetical protein AAG906_025835 [Vitis piasezkii]